MPPIKQSALSSVLRGPIETPRAKKVDGPLWKGPEVDGVTFSLLSRFLCCRERFRLLVVEGWKAVDKFSSPLEFGNMWHKCEESLADGWSDWRLTLDDYTIKLVNRYKLQQSEVLHWHDMAQALFPEYVKHWSAHSDVQKRTPFLQEQVFDVPYQLPSGRTVRLRGKWDSVDLIEEAPVGLYVQENKTKSQVDRVKLTRQLSFDLQSMTYVVALQEFLSLQRSSKLPAQPWYNLPVNGVRYNVVRRSAHKSPESMLKKFTEDRDNKRIDEWLLRFCVEVSAHDVQRFRRECLNPVLENLADDYEWWAWCSVTDTHSGHHVGRINVYDYLERGEMFPHHRSRHFRYPFGIYNPMNEGGFSEVDEYLETGSTRGLQRCENLFPELS